MPKPDPDKPTPSAPPIWTVRQTGDLTLDLSPGLVMAVIGAAITLLTSCPDEKERPGRCYDQAVELAQRG